MPAIAYSHNHCQGEPSAAATAERHERVGPCDTDGHGGKRNHQRQHKRRCQNKQRYICKRVTPTRTFDQFPGHGLKSAGANHLGTEHGGRSGRGSGWNKAAILANRGGCVADG
jgi:hypothetical protein